MPAHFPAVQPQSGGPADLRLSPPKNLALQQHVNLITKPRKCVSPTVLSQALEIEDEDDLTRSKIHVYNSVKTHREVWKQEEVEI